MDERHARLNNLFIIINSFEEYFNDEFKKTGISKCDKCFNGLKSKHDLSNNNFCNYCGGIGYVGIKKIMGEYVCRSCNGAGCLKCSKGTVDWITHTMGKDIFRRKEFY